MTVYPWLQPVWQRLHAQPGRMPHALLLEGVRGIGKKAFALAFAASRLCDSPNDNGQACGTCVSCHWLAQGTHPDFRLLEPFAESDSDDEMEDKAARRKKQEISVAQVRALIDFVNLSSHRERGRIILIHPAESMNTAAANALLKALEEPSPNTHFVLVSHQANFLLPTIRSRCQRLTLSLPATHEARVWLKGEGIPEDELCLALAGGAPLLAQSYADSTYQAERRGFLTALQHPGKLNWLHLAEQSARSDLAARFEWLQTWLVDLVTVRLAHQVRYNQDFISGLQDLAARVNVTRVQQFAQEVALIKRRLQHPLNSQLLMENVLLNYLTAVSDGRSPQ